MANSNGRISWDAIAKISQVAILPLLAAMLYILLQITSMDRRLAIIEVVTSKPFIDIALVQKIAVIEDRQNAVMRQLTTNGTRIEELSDMLMQHDGNTRGVEKKTRWRRIE